MILIKPTTIVLLALGFLAGGCSDDRGASAAPVEHGPRTEMPPRAAVVTQQSTAYRVVAITNAGTITGTVSVTGNPVGESVVAPETLPVGCALEPSNGTAVTGGNISGAFVWLTDIRSGKALPGVRRFDLVNENCNLAPKVQAIFVGATMNVGSNDAVLHENHFINVATGQSEAVAPFNDKGEIVPYDTLFGKPAEYEVNCKVHPWTRAYILVLDHPYVAETGAGGTFSLADVPPGNYHIRAWHPSYGLADGIVSVTAGGQATVSLTLGKSSGAVVDSGATRHP
jgi:hypothetical protein